MDAAHATDEAGVVAGTVILGALAGTNDVAVGAVTVTEGAVTVTEGAVTVTEGAAVAEEALLLLTMFSTSSPFNNPVLAPGEKFP